MKITQERLLYLFDYLPEGKFKLKIEMRNGFKPGYIYKGSKQKLGGYLHISIDDHTYKYHRMVWLWHYGSIPRFIDHINRNTADNRIENLRPCTTSQNMFNTEKFKKNPTSKYKGVSFHKIHKKYIAHVAINGKLKHLGYFLNEIEAAKAYDKCVKKHAGEFACLNFPNG